MEKRTFTKEEKLAIIREVSEQGLKATLEKQGAQPSGMSTADFQAFVNSERKKFGDIVRVAKVEQ